MVRHDDRRNRSPPQGGENVPVAPPPCRAAPWRGVAAEMPLTCPAYRGQQRGRGRPGTAAPDRLHSYSLQHTQHLTGWLWLACQLRIT